MVSCCGQPVFKRSATSAVGKSHSPLKITPHKAGVVRDGLMAAAFTLVAVSAERGCTAGGNGAQDFEVQTRQPATMTSDERGAVSSNNVGHLQGWPNHFFGTLLFNGKLSRGLTVSRTCCCETCK